MGKGLFVGVGNGDREFVGGVRKAGNDDVGTLDAPNVAERNYPTAVNTRETIGRQHPFHSLEVHQCAYTLAAHETDADVVANTLDVNDVRKRNNELFVVGPDDEGLRCGRRFRDARSFGNGIIYIKKGKPLTIQPSGSVCVCV